MAAERTAEGLCAAAEVRSNADRDGRITVAKAKTEAAEIDAQARREAAAIQARAYPSDLRLYTLLRTLDTLVQSVGTSTRLACDDAEPFSVFWLSGPREWTGAMGGPVVQSLQITYRVLPLGVALLARRLVLFGCAAGAVRLSGGGAAVRAHRAGAAGGVVARLAATDRAGRVLPPRRGRWSRRSGVRKPTGVARAVT